MRTLAEFEAAARERLDPVHFDFFAGGARDELTLRANETAFRRLSLLPKVLRGNSKRELGIELLGTPTSMPIVLSPTAFHRLAHPEGERATARAAARVGAIMIVSMGATTTVEDIAAAAPGGSTRWFQLYLQPDPRVTEALVRRAERAGMAALVVTVDSPVFGGRERDDRNGFHDLPSGVVAENLRELPGGEPGRAADIAMSAEFTWEHLAWLRGITSLPLLLKGVLHPEDARLAVGAGVAGLVVSNHGGRQLDTAAATIDALPEIAEAVGGAIPLILDGGIRRGTDVVKALALGATAVGVGRPVLWGLAAAGEDGVTRVLELLREEFDLAMALCGAASPSELTPDLVRTYS
ncbi:alpha-hydroxy acid oxidase [Amycolatopsis sp. H20-H5]|uniref:alpha-hydroxy acid oxidase n=1 Tax=Amycolatopsis sp. H20-H5 TaxID=3046309 RepID=UPI002DB64412|nr:alpha-hydroxy acid oxidase [Amycolatopsis sp. H20-H5]MEC3979440.1 alpha-hydroxy acid oxidase [Amycolatopsis sp. H20-H5]